MIFPAPGQLARDVNASISAQAEDVRCRTITGWEALWNGTAHASKPGFFDRSVPIIERSPAVQSGTLATAGRRLANMVFGERSFPSLSVEGTAYGVALSEAERDALSALVGELVKVARLRKIARAYLLEGLKTGAACALCELRDGRPCVRIIPAKWCTPTLDGAGRVTRLVVQYQHTGADGELYWHRRELGDGFDRVYAPVKVTRDAVNWSRIAVEHERAIAFVPVVWTRNAPESVEDGFSTDGHPLCEGLESEILAMDLELSQLFRNALYNGDPQMVRTGVEGDAPAPMGGGGREADGSKFSWFSPSSWRAAGSSVAKKAPGTIWNLPAGGDAKLLESTGAGAQIIKGAYDELKRAVSDSLGVVIADPQALGSGDLSARALSLLFGPMLDTASALRVDYGDALCEIVSMLARLCAEQPSGVYLTTLDGARAAIAKLYGAREDGARVWFGLPLSPAWGEFFEPSWSDVTAAVDAAQKATGGRPVLSQRAALRLLAPVVGVEDLNEEAADVSREAGADAETMRATMGALSPEPVPTDASVQDTALNGAQVDAMVSLAEKVALGAVPLETAVRIAVRAFQLSEPEAREMFVPAALSERAEAVAERVIAPASIVPDGPQPIE